jgi:phosphoglycolate phosphatase-like HAD superfamily hydrolase
MQALVLDFDGVISDSVEEVFIVATRAYLDLRPSSPIRAWARDDLKHGFRELMPLGNRAEDYCTALAALEQGVELPDQQAYDVLREAQDEAWLVSYRRRFYEVREALSRDDPDAWRALMEPYAPMIGLLRRRAGDALYAIATSKDRRSVEIMLHDYGIADLFPADRVFDKETGPKKTAHLGAARERLGVDYPSMTFVDDKVNHLDSVAPLGVRCVLAAWGYNGRREHALARDRGYTVCHIESAEETLFGVP